MTLGELDKSIAELRSRPLLLVCRRTGSVYIHIAADDLDALLSAELGVDNAQNRQKNAT